MFISIVPFLLMVAGALIYALSSNAKLVELGRITFAAGIFALAFIYSGKSVSF